MSDEQTRRFYKLGTIDQIAEPGTKVFQVGNKRILVARWEGKVYAIDDLCTHDNGPLGEGELLEGTDGGAPEVECPRHGARFDLKTGKALCLPAVGAVCAYSVEVREGEIYAGLPHQ